MKRSREVEMAEMASKCLMLLSRVGETDRSSRVFSCKTCSREFDSFQALGGHRTSHKKARPAGGGDEPVNKNKAHECSICGVEFAIGQALGGHMRRHRNDAVGRDRDLVVTEKKTTRDVCLDLNLGPRHEMDLSLRLGLVL